MPTGKKSAMAISGPELIVNAISAADHFPREGAIIVVGVLHLAVPKDFGGIIPVIKEMHGLRVFMG